MINYKKNLIFALGALGLICYFLVPGFYKTGDFWLFVNAAGRWFLFGILALIIQVVAIVSDGRAKDKGPRTMMTEIFFVVPLMYVIAIVLLCAGVRLWHSDAQQL